jgi:choline dehydrogenase-like flavoprotein
LDTTAKTYDAIVVGTGGAGCWAAKELSEGGMNVLVLEAGRAIDKDTDFPPIKPVEMNMWHRVGFALRGQAIQARHAGDQFGLGLSQFYVNDRHNPYSTPSDAPFQWTRGRQVGGRMHTWARVALRMSEHDFKRPDLDPSIGGEWPIGYDDVAPYYSKVESLLGIIADKDGLEKVPNGETIQDPPAVPASNRIYGEWVKEKIGIDIIRSRVIQNNLDRIPIPLTLALATGNCTLQPDAVVHRVLVDETTGKARGVGYRDRLSKAYKEVTANTVVLCASALESTRILLNSACDKFPEGIGASSGSLGRYIHDHVLVGKGGLPSAEFAEAVKAAGEKYARPATDPYDHGAYTMYVPRFCSELAEKPDFIGEYGIQTSASPHYWMMLLFGQMLPRFENRVSIHPRRKDKWGIPIAHIETRHSENEFKMAQHMSRTADLFEEKLGFKLLEAGGRVRRGPQQLIYKLLKPMAIQKSGAMLPGAAIHETGGARMGSDPEKSVVNPYCSVWDVPNVYVTDGAAFPSNACQNHTLTIMAMTVRTCEHILKEEGRDEKR